MTVAVVGGLDQRPPEMPRSLLGKPAAALALGRFDHTRVKSTRAHQLPRPVEAARLADLGEPVAGEDRPDTEDRLQRLAAAVGASEG
jgi:hypothetical protein